MAHKEPKLGDLNALSAAKTPRKPDAGNLHVRESAAAAARRSAPVVAAIESPPPAAPASATTPEPNYQSAHLLGVTGRTRRIPFINVAAFALLMMLVALGVAFAYVDAPRDGLFIAKAAGFSVVIVASVWILVSACIRRLHDLNRSGLWLLTALIPAINVLLISILVIWAGRRDDNQFGSPSPRDGLVTWLAFFFVVLLPIGLIPAGWIYYDTQSSLLRDTFLAATSDDY